MASLDAPNTSIDPCGSLNNVVHNRWVGPNAIAEHLKAHPKDDTSNTNALDYEAVSGAVKLPIEVLLAIRMQESSFSSAITDSSDKLLKTQLRFEYDWFKKAATNSDFQMLAKGTNLLKTVSDKKMLEIASEKNAFRRFQLAYEADPLRTLWASSFGPYQVLGLTNGVIQLLLNETDNGTMTARDAAIKILRNRVLMERKLLERWVVEKHNRLNHLIQGKSKFTDARERKVFAQAFGKIYNGGSDPTYAPSFEFLLCKLSAMSSKDLLPVVGATMAPASILK